MNAWWHVFTIHVEITNPGITYFYIFLYMFIVDFCHRIILHCVIVLHKLASPQDSSLHDLFTPTVRFLFLQSGNYSNDVAWFHSILRVECELSMVTNNLSLGLLILYSVTKYSGNILGSFALFYQPASSWTFHAVVTVDMRVWQKLCREYVF